MAYLIIHESESFVPPLRGQEHNSAEEKRRIRSLLQQGVKDLQTLGRAERVLNHSVFLSSDPQQMAAGFSWPEIQEQYYIEYLYTKEAILPPGHRHTATCL